MNNAFLKSFQTLSSIYTEKSFSSIALNRCLAFCSAKDKALITKIVYGVLDNDIKLNYIISKYVRKMPKNEALIYLKIGLYCLTELSIPPYAVVNDIAELSKLSADKRIVGFVNATLKNISATVKDFSDYPDDETLRLSIEYSYPEWALRKLIKDYGTDVARKIVCEPADERSTIRVTELFDINNLQQNDCVVASSMFDDAFYVRGKLPKLDETYTVQSLSSMAIARICANNIGEKFLDCCSAPGGKSVYVKQLCPSAEVYSFDAYPHRIELVKSYAARMNVDIKAYCADMTVYDETLADKFDTVLCDAPCSGFGALNNHPDIKLFRQSEDISSLMKLQYSILSNCSRYVKPGGRLIYSTCTVFDNENGQIVRKFLKEHCNFTYDTIILPQFPDANGKPSYQFLPYKDGVQGFFVAVLKRTE